MYSIVATFVLATGADVPDALLRHRASAGCVGTTVAAQGCSSQVQAYKLVPVKAAGGCVGSYAEHVRRTPLRNAAANAVARHDERVEGRVQARAARSEAKTTFHKSTATYIATPAPLPAAPPLKPTTQSAAPPIAVAPLVFAPPVRVYRAPVRAFVGNRVCPAGGPCP